MSKKRFAIGIDIGGTNTKLALVNSSGEVFHHLSFKTEDYHKFDEYFKILTSHIDDLIKKHNSNLDGIGIGAPNVNYHTGVLESPINIPWGKIALREKIIERYKLKTVVDNDANAALLGESLFGKAKGFEDVIQVTLGTGVGTGLMSHGRIIRGKNGKAGEGGHLVVVENGRLCACGGLGHLECYASSRGVRLIAQEIIGRSLGAREISELYIQNDPKAIEVVNQTCKHLGFGLSMMCSLLNPSLIVLSGGVSLLAQDLAQKTKTYLDQFTFQIIRGEAEVVVSNISQKEGSVLGAAALLWEDELSSFI
jgi:glucokinase